MRGIGRDATGRSASSGSPACRSRRSSATPRTARRRARVAMILTGRGPEQQSQGVDNALAYINLALALGRSGKPCGGYGSHHRAGQRPGRPRARPEGRPAARLPPHRRSRRAAPRRGGLGHRPEDDLPGPGQVRLRAAAIDGRGDGVRALLVIGLEHRRVGAGRARIERAARSARPAGRLRLLPVRDRGAGRRRPARRAVGRGRRHDDQPRGAGHPAPPGVAPPAGVRTDLDDPRAPSPAALGHRATGSPTSGAQRRLRRAAPRHARAARPTTRGITYERIDAEDGVFWPCPDADSSGHAAAVRRPASRRRAAAPGFTRSRTRPPAEERDDDYPLLLTTGRVLAHYQSGTQTRRVAELQALAPEPFAEMHPATARRLGVARRRRIALTTRRGSAPLHA